MPSEWSEEREKAAQLLAKDKRSSQIAKTLGISRGKLSRWKADPEFTLRVHRGTGKACRDKPSLFGSSIVSLSIVAAGYG